jgi:filamentous hemagglutinin
MPEIASTSWWVDFSNFSEGVGALGGGNVKLIAGRDVSNVDAVVPTNARMPTGTPSAASLVELGGGDLLVQAGRNINGGVYYVERGLGALRAGGSIHTHPPARAYGRPSSYAASQIIDPQIDVRRHLADLDGHCSG